jgi:LPS-assembly protein
VIAGMMAHRRRSGRAFLAATTALATALAAIPALTQADAQTAQTLGASVSPNAQLLLEADTLVYDNDGQTITATGHVRIDYDGIRMTAGRVVYDRKNARMKAYDKVEIIDRQGNKSYAEEIDVTDDFADGFAKSLRLETTDKTYFGAASAERKGGDLTIFNQGVYTACAPCENKPGRPPIWRVKAQKVIWNGKEKTIRFERASFELFGMPIAMLPYLTIPDHTEKRATGFLIPSVRGASELGYGLSVPFYWAISPTYDLTLTGTGYTLQGFLGEAEWRQRFDSGSYSVKVAGISQQRPERFNSNWIDSQVTGRTMIGTKGQFNINPRWAFGWDVLAQSDKNFSHTYNIDGFGDSVHTSQVYLTGLNGRNYFDLHFMKYQVQERTPNSVASARDPMAPWVLPSFDYSYTPEEMVGGGQLTVNVNSQVISRSRQDVNAYADVPGYTEPAGGQNVRGIKGTSGRLTAEAEWKRSFTAPGGLILTPILAARADAIQSDPDAVSQAAINTAANALGTSYDNQSQYYRGMATAGLEARWPILFSSPNITQVVEPVAQVFVRPNAPHEAQLGIPNEDAQSFVFDSSSLFDRDKFSGYDRIEGGTRANLGIRYSANFGNGWSANGLFGQSYKLAGENPFAQPDLVSAGAFSGLDTNVSDFVGAVGLNNGIGFTALADARFDKDDFAVRRAGVGATASNGLTSVTGRYDFIDAQPLYGFPNDRQEVSLGASAHLTENWKVFGSGTYNLEVNDLVNNSIGFSYADECFTYSMAYSESKTLAYTGNVLAPNDTTRNIGFFVSFRTLGDIGTNSAALN